MAETCHECHGEDGNSLSSSYPKLAGQYADYLIKQIRDFKSGARENAVMTIMARGLSDAAFVDIAAHFAVSKPVPGEGRDNPRGRELFLNGDAGKGVPACVGCHGANGRGVVSGSVIYPAIGGQQVVYLREQLRNWRNGGRRNSAGGVMNEVAKPLTDDEIAALAEYVGSL
ncbi:MAG: cytochrome c4 [Magnetospirillum sp.]|nr:cytochrome c4 [Magnetospirillum sp.]